jgi:hypothetical protein
MKTSLRETDLFPPLAGFFEKEGYTVHAEVRGVDIAARKGGALVLVELKLRLNLELILQAAAKQGAADETYVAVPVRGKRTWPPRWSAIRELLSRLGIGVFFVRFIKGEAPQVQMILAAEDPRLCGKLKKKKTLRADLIREMDGRPANFNTGGSVGKKLVTAYLVQALRVVLLFADRKAGAQAAGNAESSAASKQKPARGLAAKGLLIRGGKKPERSAAKKLLPVRRSLSHTTPCREKNALSPKDLRELGAPENCASILQNNFYGWFRRERRGLYTLTAEGEAAPGEFAPVVEKILTGEKVSAST